MTLYYSDQNKHNIHAKHIVQKCIKDNQLDQYIDIQNNVFGVTIRPGKKWTSFCEKQYYKHKANHVLLEDIAFAPDNSLNFVNNLHNCQRLTIQNGCKLDLSPLAGNNQLVDLQIYPFVKTLKFDLASLPGLRRCMVPLCPQLLSLMECRNLVCLHLCGGRFEGCIELDSLPALQEFWCSQLSKITQVVFNSEVRLRSLSLMFLKAFKTIEPLRSVVEELLYVKLDKTPLMPIQWLAQAHKVECIALRIGKIPSINCLKYLKNLQVLDLFGSKIMDQDFSVRDSLKGELDSRYWGGR